MSRLIMEKGRAGRSAFTLPKLDVEKKDRLIPEKFRRKSPAKLPEVSELDLVRHYTNLSKKNFSIDSHFYPLGSCTMKYNPKINEKIAAMPAFARLHPLQPEDSAQGTLLIMHRLERALAEIAGMDAVTLQPAAGAHGELTGLMLIRAYLRDRGETKRNEVLIPDSAHGTNPATCTLCGFRAVPVRSNKDGLLDLEDFSKKLSDRTAAMMITNPSTLGLFERDIVTVADRLHEAGAQLYMDGANMNAILGRTRPGDFGVDVMHFNLHKTFSTPHGGGGPGSGPVACRKHLEPFLPVPRLRNENGRFRFDRDRPKTIGAIKAFYGNVGMHVRAYAYIRFHGAEGLRRIAENAVLNANYLKARLRKAYPPPFDRTCMHEFVISGSRFRKSGIHALDIAKRLLDYGFHPPTIYFPLIVPECLMIEPTETENKETLDAFADAMIQIRREIKENPDLVKNAPHTLPVKRLDEVGAARNPVVRYTEEPAGK